MHATSGANVKPNPSDDAVSVHALSVVAQSLGVRLTPIRARDAVHFAATRAGGAGRPQHPLSALQAAAHEVSLSASPLELSARRAVAVAGRRMPLVCMTADSRGEHFLIIRRRRGRRVEALRLRGSSAEPLRLTSSQLAELVGKPDVNAPIRWLGFERELPLEPDAHGHGHGHHDHETPPFRRVAQLLWPDRRDILYVCLFAVAVGVLSLGTPIAVQALVNFVAFGGLLQPVFVLSLLLLAILSLAGAIRTLKTFVVEILQRRVFARVVTDLAARLPHVRTEAYDREHGPELVNRYFEIVTVQRSCSALLLDGVSLALQTVIGLVVLAFYHPTLLLFDICLILAILFVVFVLGRGAVRTAIGESRAKYAVAAALEEIARCPLAYKQAGGASLARERAAAATHEYLHARGSHFGVIIRQVVGAVLIQALASTALLALGGWLVIANQLTLGQLIAAELIVAIVVSAFAKMGKQLEAIYDLAAAADKLGTLIDLPLEPRTGSPLQKVSGPVALEIAGVDFAYSTGRTVLNGFGLRGEAGSRVAIVGAEGSGKSAIADILYGLRRPDTGRILLDGIDIRELNVELLRERVALVRGVEILAGDVLENVQMHRAAVTYDRARTALDSVGLLNEVLELPDGLRTRLGPTGSPLSNSQARRLMLARALAACPGLLLLDDVIDHGDPVAAAALRQAIDRNGAQLTLIVLTQRPPPSEDFDVIIALDAVEMPSPPTGPRETVRPLTSLPAGGGGA